jgi:hypothetical protein
MTQRSEVIARLHGEVGRALRDPDVRKRLASESIPQRQRATWRPCWMGPGRRPVHLALLSLRTAARPLVFFARDGMIRFGLRVCDAAERDDAVVGIHVDLGGAHQVVLPHSRVVPTALQNLRRRLQTGGE